ncbi:PQQ-dependent sugar dehydrogenase [uncultured Friedmanniella sp.]|uniref:PQQ-dependent sugar dehydrogenase n=1 Tax=uncultured Friedmanniella sp. TaxID=335381 RepID=UPI0035CBD9CC
MSRRSPVVAVAPVLMATVTLLAAGCTTAADTVPVATSAPSTSGAPLVDSALGVRAGLDAAPLDEPRTVLAPPGWTVSVWARVGGARLEAWTPDGRLLVSRPTSGDVVALTPSTSGTPSASTLVSGLNQPHGLAFAGSTLYVAESDRVDAYDYGAGSVSGRRTVVEGLPDAKSPELRGAYAHALKSVAVGEDGSIYVSVGSTGNVSAEDRDASPQRATILRVPPGGGNPTVFARGVRNGTGLATDPDGSVWTAVNNRDNLAYPYDRAYGTGGGSDQGKVLPAYVADHPMEELAKLTAGRDLGWPYCNPEPDVDPGAAGSALTYADRPFVRDVETNADGSKLDCAGLSPVEQGMGAHSAPLGLSFTSRLPEPYGTGALVGIHGSWNRQPPRAPEVAFFGWKDGALGDQQTLLSGFQDADGDRWGRPVMAVVGPDKSVYVTDDDAGAVYRMTPPAP